MKQSAEQPDGMIPTPLLCKKYQRVYHVHSHQHSPRGEDETAQSMHSLRHMNNSMYNGKADGGFKAGWEGASFGKGKVRDPMQYIKEEFKI